MGGSDETGVGFWLLWGLALVGMSGCAMSERRRNATLAGAAIGRAMNRRAGLKVQ